MARLTFEDFIGPDINTRKDVERAPFGGGKGAMARALTMLARGEIYGVHDHFDQKAIEVVNNWTLNADAGATTFAVAAARGGTVAGSTGATNADGHSMIGQRIFSPADTIFFEARFKVDVVTNIALEVGLVDVVTDKTTGVVTDIDIPTIANGATSVALVAMDTSQTLTTLAGVAGSATAAKASTGTPTLVAATYMVVRIVVAANGSVFWMVDNDISKSGWLPSAVLTTATMAPWICIYNRSAAAKAMTVDRVTCLAIAP